MEKLKRFLKKLLIKITVIMALLAIALALFFENPLGFFSNIFFVLFIILGIIVLCLTEERKEDKDEKEK